MKDIVNDRLKTDVRHYLRILVNTSENYLYYSIDIISFTDEHFS